MATRYVFRRVTTVTVLMADPGEVSRDEYGEEIEYGCYTAKERDESAREWAEQALPLDDYAENFVTVEHGPVELVEQAPAEGGHQHPATGPCLVCGDRG